MKILKTKDKIIIENSSEFNIKELLECGQVFSYELVVDDYFVISLD